MYQIAIVEDEDIYAKLLEEYIHRYEKDSFHQFKIRHYRDGAEIAENYRGGFDIILMDIQMKFMDGMTAAELIRKRDPEVLIIFITNRSDYAVRGYEVDALDYVVKPVEYFSFSQKLDRAVSRRGRSRDRHIMIHSDGGTAMLYREFNIPAGTEALRLSWKWRVTGLKKGNQSWFDARIMMEFMDAGRAKVGGA